MYAGKQAFGRVSAPRGRDRTRVFPRMLRVFTRPAAPVGSVDGGRDGGVPSGEGATLARALAPILLATIFWADTTAPPAVDVAALYVAPALLFIRTGRFWEPLLVAVVATALTFAADAPRRPAAGFE